MDHKTTISDLEVTMKLTTAEVEKLKRDIEKLLTTKSSIMSRGPIGSGGTMSSKYFSPIPPPWSFGDILRHRDTPVHKNIHGAYCPDRVMVVSENSYIQVGGLEGAPLTGNVERFSEPQGNTRLWDYWEVDP